MRWSWSRFPMPPLSKSVMEALDMTCVSVKRFTSESPRVALICSRK
eukprot:CAMPEP_0171125436 /NCGR_PEP_ID=MMETSP0766_2-20121228/111248_1 /TAXON_ID=439317 /ORGANISM="Gambierdiscus australes, Strain CAWD 149" /LENGTH=45 /DNA_ID= /DNA_START= /DNA_END= /DNA_ORIENTATION=